MKLLLALDCLDKTMNLVVCLQNAKDSLNVEETTLWGYNEMTQYLKVGSKTLYSISGSTCGLGLYLKGLLNKEQVVADLKNISK